MSDLGSKAPQDTEAELADFDLELMMRRLPAGVRYLIYIILTALGLALLLLMGGLALAFDVSLVRGPTVFSHVAGSFGDAWQWFLTSVTSSGWMKYEVPGLLLVIWLLALWTWVALVAAARKRLGDSVQETSHVPFSALIAALSGFAALCAAASATSMYLILRYYVVTRDSPVPVAAVCGVGIVAIAAASVALLNPRMATVMLEISSEGVGIFLVGVGLALSYIFMLGFALALLVAVIGLFIGMYLLGLSAYGGPSTLFGPFQEFGSLPTGWRAGSYFFFFLVTWEAITFAPVGAINRLRNRLRTQHGHMPTAVNIGLLSLLVVYIMAMAGLGIFVVYEHVRGQDLVFAGIFAVLSGIIAGLLFKLAPVIAVLKWISTPAVWLFKRLYARLQDARDMHKWLRIGEEDGRSRAEHDLAAGTLLQQHSAVAAVARDEADEHEGMTSLRQQRAYREGFREGYLSRAMK